MPDDGADAEYVDYVTARIPALRRLASVLAATAQLAGAVDEAPGWPYASLMLVDPVAGLCRAP